VEGGLKPEAATVNSHSVATLTSTGAEVEALKPAIPVKFAVRLWLPAAKATEGLAVPEELRATLASWTGLPWNWSTMATMPEVTGVPLTATVTERGCTHPLRVPAVSVVVVDTPMGNASAGTASALTNPATNTSREARQFMPLTCTCSKTQNRVPPACRSPESYCIRRGRTGANGRAAI
jgi:hypothetical protein